MKLIKRLIIVLITFIILIALAAIVLSYTVDINQYKGKIENIVKTKLGRVLKINGNISWSFFPSLSIEIKDASLSNPDSFKGKNEFMHWQTAYATIDVFDLIKGKVKIDSVILNGVSIHLVKNQFGQNNWAFNKQDNHVSQKKQQENLNRSKQKEMASPTKSQSSILANIQIKNIKINNAKVTYDDIQTKKKFNIDNLNVSLEQDSYKAPINFSLVFAINEANGWNALNTVSGSLIFNFKNNIINLSKLQYQIVFKSDQLKELKNNAIVLNGDLTLDLNKSTLASQNISIIINQQHPIILANLIYNVGNNNYQGNFSLSDFAALTFMKNYGIPIPKLPNPDILTISDNLTFFAKGGPNILQLSNINGLIAGSNVKGSVNFLSLVPFRPLFHLNINSAIVSNYIDLKGAFLELNDININGQVKYFDKQLYGHTNIDAKNALLKGLDINKIAIDFQNFLKSLANTDHIGRNFQALRREIIYLNILGSQVKINPNNGRQTMFFNLKINNKFTGNKMLTKQLSVDGDHFFIAGNGLLNWQANNLDYQLKSYVYNPKSSNLADYQKIAVPYKIDGQLDQVRFKLQQKQLEQQLQPLLQKTLRTILEKKAAPLLDKLFR